MSDPDDWRPIPSLPGYEVSKWGRVRDQYGPLVIYRTSAGYLYVSVKVNGRWTSRVIGPLVCEAFIGPRPTPDAEADHRDEVRAHNHLDNLRWLPKALNFRTKRVRAADDHPHAKLDVTKVAEIRRRYALDRSKGVIKRWATEYGVSTATISQVVHGKRWVSTWEADRQAVRESLE